MIVQTKNFTPTTDPKLLCTCGDEYCDRRSVQQWVLDNVQLMRDDYGQPMGITSGGRCMAHPDEVGRMDTDHQNCIVVDIKYKTVVQRNQLMVLAGRYGATAVAYGRGFVHAAWRDCPDKRVRTWEY